MILSLGFVFFHLFSVLIVQGQVSNSQLLREKDLQIPLIALPKQFLHDSVKEAFRKATYAVNFLKVTLADFGRILLHRIQNIPSARHQKFQGQDPRSQRCESEQADFEEATRYLINKYRLSLEQIRYELSKIDLKSMLPDNVVEKCESQYKENSCRNNSPYRTFDGSCNNLQNPSWGRASTCFQRLLYPDYEDGVSAKRVARSGNPLPSPREISLNIHAHMTIQSHHVTEMLMAFGQFLTHDISQAPLSTGPNNQQLECCPVTEDDPPQCDPILLDRDDPFYSSFGINCLNNVRTAKCSTCSLGPRQQINQPSSYIDASHVYGLHSNDSRALRNNDGTGTMRFVEDPDVGELPPPSFHPKEDLCSFQDPKLKCFELGDQRANQHPALTSLHILSLREHNRIARILKKLNRNWCEEKLFQESRKILGAELQMIAFHELLPVLIGEKMMKEFDLNVRFNGYTQYNKTVQANLFNEFSGAVFRFGHSMIRSLFPLPSGQPKSSYRLKENFHYPFDFYRGEFDGLVDGLAQSRAQKCDRHMVRDVTNHLYQYRGNDTGLDLASLNINRGRDHGIPSYTKVVEFCGGPQISDWEQLNQLFQSDDIKLFRIYEDVRDIDLFSGGLAERPNEGAILGPTFSYIVAIQFYHLKFGDRYYFEHGNEAGTFTKVQLQELRKTSLAKMICDNSNLDTIQENAMLHPSESNKEMKCEDLTGMDLTAWSEENQ